MPATVNAPFTFHVTDHIDKMTGIRWIGLRDKMGQVFAESCFDGNTVEDDKRAARYLKKCPTLRFEYRSSRRAAGLDARRPGRVEAGASHCSAVEW